MQGIFLNKFLFLVKLHLRKKPERWRIFRQRKLLKVRLLPPNLCSTSICIFFDNLSSDQIFKLSKNCGVNILSVGSSCDNILKLRQLELSSANEAVTKFKASEDVESNSNPQNVSCQGGVSIIGNGYN